MKEETREDSGLLCAKCLTRLECYIDEGTGEELLHCVECNEDVVVLVNDRDYHDIQSEQTH